MGFSKPGGGWDGLLVHTVLLVGVVGLLPTAEIVERDRGDITDARLWFGPVMIFLGETRGPIACWDFGGLIQREDRHFGVQPIKFYHDFLH